MPKPLKTFTIQDVSRILHVTKHTLRFWEKELEGVLVPHRTQGQQRRYSAKHLYIIEEIKRLKEKGLTLGRIKEKLKQQHRDESDNLNPQRVDILADQIAEIVKSAVYNFLRQAGVEEKYGKNIRQD